MKNPAEPGSEKKSSRLKMVIILLSILLALSAGGLAARVIYLNFFAPAQATTTVPDNLIGEQESSVTEMETSSVPTNTAPESTAPSETGAAAPTSRPVSEDKHQAAKLELYQGHPGDNEKFEIRNLLPGDSVTKYFCVKAYHDEDITLYFNTEITEETKALGNVLHIKVTHLDTGKVLCDAPFAEVKDKEFSELLPKNAQGETTAYYQIDVSLDTSVGNEYQAALLKADFNWTVKDEGGLTPPPTGDTTNMALWLTLALSSLMLIFLLLLKRRKEDEQHGQA